MMLKDWVRAYVPSSVARIGRGMFARIRYQKQLRDTRRGFREYGEQHSRNLLFVAGLPKSGTSWMESMLASYPGFHCVMPPDIISYELKHGGSHDYKLPAGFWRRFEDNLAVLKLHVNGSQHNAKQLRAAGIPYLIMYRDLRDVAVSHYFYVRRTPWHPEHDTYTELDIEAGLIHFGRTLLPAFDDWVRSWEYNRDEDQSLIVRYEDLLSDTQSVFSDVAELFELDDSDEIIRDIVQAHSFEKVSGGRERGQQSDSSFYRKGVSGDWRNHFTGRVREVFKENAEGFWVDHGYEENCSW